MKNYQLTENPNFWRNYKWGQDNNKGSVSGRDRFLKKFSIDTQYKILPNKLPRGYSERLFSHCDNAAGACSFGEIFKISGEEKMMMTITIRPEYKNKFKLKNWETLEEPLSEGCITFYKIEDIVEEL